MKPTSKLKAFSLIPMVCFAGCAIAAETRPFQVEDLMAMKRLSDPQASPDGKLIAFALRTTDVEANAGRTDLWIVDTAGGEPRQLTTHVAADTQPRFAADGSSIYFLSPRSGSSQVWRLALGGGEAEPVTQLPLDIDNLLVFPDGKRLLVSMEVYPDGKTLEDTVKRDSEKAASKVKARVYEEALFRHWDSWEDGKRSHWFVYDLETKVAKDLMAGSRFDAPTKPFGGSEEAAISPDGRTVVFATQNAGRDAAWSTNVDLFAVPADGSAPPRNLTDENDALDNLPVFSPDGTQLAYVAMKRPMYEADRQGVTVLDLKSGARKEVAPDWDRSASSLTWSRDGKRLYVTADHVGATGLFVLDAVAGGAKPIWTKGTASSPVALPSGLVFLSNDLKRPDEIFGSDETDVWPITRVNEVRLESIFFGDYEQYSFTGAHGDKVYGYVMKPAIFESGKKYPVAFLIHGGPQGTFSDRFHYRWNPQIYAGRGYATVFVDFHGSTGYGQAFTDAIRGDWGGAPYEDLMKGLDAALAQHDFLDGSRVAALGASYGGYMINWIAGQTDRFRCLVNHDGNLDERMAYFDTEELWFPEWEHHGTPWENPEGYAQHNPIDYVKNWKTPMLVIHGGNDFRVVDTQGIATFNALQRKGIPSKFLHFPDENHWVLKPQNSIFWHQTVLEWIDRFTKTPAGG